MTRLLLLIFTTLMVNGCSNYLYYGKTSYEYNGKQCEAVAFWRNTTSLFSSGKVDSVEIQTSNSFISYQLKPGNNDDMILLFPAGFHEYDTDVTLPDGYEVQQDTELFCGIFTGKQQHMEHTTVDTTFEFFCRKVMPPPLPLSAQNSPYVFKMEAPIRRFSFFGEPIESPTPAKCR